MVFQWKAATDPDGDAITDYHFQLSDHPEMRWPMSPNFDKYVSRTPDKGSTRYTLPRPGLLTHGKTYYWHVKAKDLQRRLGAMERHLEFHGRRGRHIPSTWRSITTRAAGQAP